MKGMLLGPILAGAILSSGCATMAVTIPCVYDACPDEVWLDVAWKVDADILDAVLGSDDGPRGLLKRVSVEGVVTSDGTPLYQARAVLTSV